ncbi:MAG: DNA polymerase III subunit epsilon [Candidatus Makana argininalis]
MKKKIIRQIVIDTETTGMNRKGIHYKNHKIIEIGAVEILNRNITGNYFHTYIKPDRDIETDAFNIHGISNEFLKNKPKFSEIAYNFFNFIKGCDIIIHNAPFDIGFINYEFSMINMKIKKINNYCNIIDSLSIARKLFPGKRNSLDALCNRYNMNNKKRNKHGALLDAEILADIFLLMTGGQKSINFNISEYQNNKNIEYNNIYKNVNKKKKIIYASKDEIHKHELILNNIYKKNKKCLWKKK